MAKLTNTVLVDANNALRLMADAVATENSELRHGAETDAATHQWLMAVEAGKIRDLEADVAKLKAALLDVTSVASAVNRISKPQRPAYVAPQWQLDRAAAMAAAKAQAMAGRTTVRV